MEKPRQIAFEILQRHAEAKDFVEDLLNDRLNRSSLPPNDRGLVHELVCGVVRYQRALDWVIDQRTEGRPQQAIIRTLLRLGLYQLLWLERIPSHAAVHETVQQAKDLGLGPISGFINALLRGVAGSLDDFRQRLRQLELESPDIAFSHPTWLVDRWNQRWGNDATVALLRWNNQPPPVYARLNRIRTDEGRLEEAWKSEGVNFERMNYPWTKDVAVYHLQQHPPLAGLKSFQEGGFYIQDPSTLFAVTALNPQPGETILDMCAAPGGKTTLIADLMQNQGRIIAQDSHRARLEMVKQNCSRLGVSCVQVSTSTGVSHPELSLAFDRILVDAPCSNTGVMRRRVDLRWRVSAQEIHRLQVVQKDLLADAAVQLKPGGLLVYSTCSLETEENDFVAQDFVAHHPEFRCLQTQQLKPFEHQVDGAFIAVFRKRASSSSPDNH